MDARMAVPLFSTSSSEAAFRRRTLRAAAGLRLSFGDIALGVFLLTQLLDGVYTYVGVRTFVMHAEGNPIIATLITHLGNGPALLSAKVAASNHAVDAHFLL